MKTLQQNRTQGVAHCPMCTHTVPAEVDLGANMLASQPARSAPAAALPWKWLS